MAGKSPIRDYIDALPGQDAGRIDEALDHLEEFGTALEMPWVRHVEGRLWELRIRGRTAYRIIYAAASGRRLVLLHAFMKKTEKMPRKELELAQERLLQYQRRGKV